MGRGPIFIGRQGSARARFSAEGWLYGPFRETRTGVSPEFHRGAIRSFGIGPKVDGFGRVPSIHAATIWRLPRWSNGGGTSQRIQRWPAPLNSTDYF